MIARSRVLGTHLSSTYCLSKPMWFWSVWHLSVFAGQDLLHAITFLALFRPIVCQCRGSLLKTARPL